MVKSGGRQLSLFDSPALRLGALGRAVKLALNQAAKASNLSREELAHRAAELAAEAGVIDVNALTVTKFGSAGSDTYKYYGGVYVGDGKVVAVSYSATQFALIDVNALTVTKFGPTEAGNYKYSGGVYVGGGKVLAIPCHTTQAALIDAGSLTVTKFGPAESGTGFSRSSSQG